MNFILYTGITVQCVALAKQSRAVSNTSYVPNGTETLLERHLEMSRFTREDNRRWLENSVQWKASKIQATPAEIEHALDVACDYMENSVGGTNGQIADVGVQAIRTRRNQR